MKHHTTPFLFTHVWFLDCSFLFHVCHEINKIGQNCPNFLVKREDAVMRKDVIRTYGIILTDPSYQQIMVNSWKYESLALPIVELAVTNEITWQEFLAGSIIIYRQRDATIENKIDQQQVLQQ